MLFSIKGIQDSVERWLILGLGPEICKVILENLLMLESKGVLEAAATHTDGRVSEPIERAPNGQSWDNMSNEIRNILLD